MTSDSVQFKNPSRYDCWRRGPQGRVYRTAGSQRFVVLDSARPDLQKRQPQIVDRGTPFQQSSYFRVRITGQRKSKVNSVSTVANSFPKRSRPLFMALLEKGIIVTLPKGLAWAAGLGVVGPRVGS